MSEQTLGGRIIDRIMSGEYEHPDVEEKLYADNEATVLDVVTTVEESTVPDGHEGMIVSIAVSSEDAVIMYLNRDGKQYYENGLNLGGLSYVPETGTDQYGVGDEVFLGIRIKEKGKWQLQFKSTAGTPDISWRLRVRHFKIKKGS